MKITRAWLGEQLDASRLARGEILFLDGAVQQCEVIEQGSVIHGEVEDGSRRYASYIELDADGVDGDCACSQGYNCEHVAALLLAQMTHQNGQQSDKSVETQAYAHAPEPQNSIAPIKTHSQTYVDDYPADVHQRILYIIHPQWIGDRLDVEVVTARLLQGGTYSDTTPYLLRNFANRILPRFVLPIDLEIINHTKKADLDDGSYHFVPIDIQGSALMHMLLQTGRCHWMDVNQPPLTLGEERRGTWLWSVNEQAMQTLCLRVPDAKICKSLAPASLIIPSSPPFYLSEDESQCGPITTDCPVQLYTSLFFSTGVIFPEKRSGLLDHIAFDWPDSVPEPEPLNFHHVDVAPKPVLTLLYHADNRYLNGFRLQFDYGGHLTHVAHYIDEPIYYQQNGQWLETRCDRDAERACVKQLREAGLRGGFQHRSTIGTNPDLIPEWFLPTQMDWAEFIACRLGALQQAGFRVEIPPGFRYDIVQIRQWDVACKEHGIMGEIHFEVTLEDGLVIDLIDVVASWVKENPERLSDSALRQLVDLDIQYITLPDGRILPMTGKMLHGMLSAMQELFSMIAADHHATHNATAMQWLNLRDALADHPYVHFRDNEAWLHRMRQLANIDAIPATTPPSGLNVTLRGYQQRGLNWLQHLRRLDTGALLADDMGLGKTIQTLAHLLKEKETGNLQRPALLIAPTSLMHNWKAEAARFTPGLKVLLLHGASRKDYFPSIREFDLVLTTYGLLRSDGSALKTVCWSLLILDEAQYIRNSRTGAARIARELDAEQRICLTGTPMENHLGELWSLFDFLMPGYLYDVRTFTRYFRKPIEREADSERQRQLNLRIRPFMLRRSKEEVAAELPAKTEIIRTVAMEEDQRILYEGIRLMMHQKVREAMQRMGKGQSQIIMLDALLKMRQICCDPRLLKQAIQQTLAEDASYPVTLASIDKAGSAKLDLLRSMLPEMIAEGRRILLFSQFTRMLKLIEALCKELSIPYLLLTGATRDRATPVKAFQKHEAPLFLISLKAGGVGLNLTAADTIIHYDPWWNPAAEAQASDRAHRIGQDKPVFVYKLITEGSVESRVLDMQRRKQRLADALYQGSEKASSVWSEEELETLFAPLEET
ncbi:MAG: DNA/RNA helicase [Zetaproteobacteria bacterium CG_4_9_14_3_um_filter_49_83]|nr:MAG: hypothetical protein AUJ56_13460 [Zetaproteobacteria bacterium CG1_02_49_23]PIQ31342.1 MAG: DNA/RNA helicase [Zetaproteobacteria bacterium CG17_big_fil_post_rev_8_21_14_2_50_50_13]PIV31681.1 MAG: DNA/RNA helicase [Zetaproteobacteria bacterium CG02_land_8_20_14_3_00_50_9]PIY55372.1 MAG: DNA/RNA helicase [Zetaproteobacteria bacterium CG_4_10_14_0_8_um_filter_49_80]PJA34936.1 MAG: DNA/RNA helicase [Zetaproteobacteria bacterium CG_4_9_14_3_um_filter_49_83]